MKHSALVTTVWVALGMLVMPRAMADAFSWNNAGSGSAYWGNSAKWTRTGPGPQTWPSVAGDTVSVPAFASGLNIAAADSSGAASSFTLRSFTVESSSQSRRISNPATGTSTLVFDYGGVGTNVISVTMNGSDRIMSIADRVNVQLNQTLRTTHGSNQSTPVAILGVISGIGGIEVTGLLHHLRLANINTYSGDTTVYGSSSGFTGVDSWEKSLFADGGASAAGSSTGTGQVILTGSASGTDFHRPILRGSGVVGQTGRTGTTLTLSSTSGDTNSFPRVSPGGTLTTGGGRTATLGTLTVNGNVAFGNGSRLDVEYGDTTNDILRVNGSLMVSAANSVLSVARLSGTVGTLARVYEIVQYDASGRTGAFASVLLPAELTAAGYRTYYDRPSSLGAGHAAITLEVPPSATVLTLR